MTHPNAYGLMAMVGEEGYSHLMRYTPSLDRHVRFYMPREVSGDIAPQHLSICYFSYPQLYPPLQVRTLVPRIRRIAGSYMPLRIVVQGLEGGWERGWRVPAVMWHIIDYGHVHEMRDAVRTELKDEIAHFRENEIFEPHIGVAVAKTVSSDLKRIVQESRKDDAFTLELSSLQIFFPSGPEKIFRVSS